MVAGERPVQGERDQGRESLGCSKSRLWRSIVGTCLQKVKRVYDVRRIGLLNEMKVRMNWGFLEE